MQSWHGGFESRSEAGEAIDELEPLEDARIQEAIASDVHTVAGAQDYVVSQASAVVAKIELEVAVNGESRSDCCAGGYGDAAQTLSQPARTGRARGENTQAILELARKSPQQVRSGYDAADSGRANVGRREKQV
jgi:hypothetical protein